MYTPHTVTVWYTGGAEPHVTVLRGVFYDAAKAANAAKVGMEGADAVDLYIPLSVKATDAAGEPRQFVGPKAFAAAEDKSGLWTLDTGQTFFFVKGEVTEGRTFQEVNARHDNVHRITKVDVKDFGSPSMHHIQVGGA